MTHIPFEEPEEKRIIINIHSGCASLHDELPEGVVVEIRDYDIQQEFSSIDFQKDEDGDTYHRMIL